MFRSFACHNFVFMLCPMCTEWVPCRQFRIAIFIRFEQTITEHIGVNQLRWRRLRTIRSLLISTIELASNGTWNVLGSLQDAVYEPQSKWKSFWWFLLITLCPSGEGYWHLKHSANELEYFNIKIHSFAFDVTTTMAKLGPKWMKFFSNAQFAPSPPLPPPLMPSIVCL